MKQILLLFTLSFLLTFSISNTYIKVSAQNLPVHNIDTGIDYATIQEAIDASNTTNGHTILVDDGTYHEHVNVHKTVKLLAADQSKAIIDGNGTGQVVSLTASAAQIAGFTVQNAEYGIFIHSSSGCRIANNTVMSTSQAGIYLWESIENLITNNTIANTSHGIWLLSYSTNNIISNNFVTNSPQGIVSSYNCNNNTIISNTVISSRLGGVVMGGAYNNTIYHNNIEQAWSYGDSSNFWDDGTEGNFWKDYSGSDTDEDGIGETPYTIDGKNQDNHPLMGMFNDFTVTWEEECYHVYVISNSTISGFDFRVTYEPAIGKAIVFNVTGEDAAVGFCRIMIPTALVNYSYTVLVDGKEVDYTLLEDISNSTHAYLYFTYTTSTKQVLIVREYASSLMLPLLLISTIVAVVFSKKKDDKLVVNYLRDLCRLKET